MHATKIFYTFLSLILILSLTGISANLIVEPSSSIDLTSSSISGSDIDKLITFFANTSASGGIPIRVVTETKTNWTQYVTSILLSSIMLFWIFGQIVMQGFQGGTVKMLLKGIKKKTGRNVVMIKHTSQDLFAQSMIDDKTLYKLQTAMNEFDGKPFDLILHTPGGSVFSAMYISRLLKEYPGHIRAIVPSYSMSGGSLLALSCDEIVMNAHSTIGPIDPQLGSLFKYGSAKSWNKIVKYKGKKAEDSSISLAMTGAQYTKSIRDHLLSTLDFGLSTQQKKAFAEFLTSGNVEHAFQLTPEVLSKFGIKVKTMKNLKLIGKLLKIISKIGGEGVIYV